MQLTPRPKVHEDLILNASAGVGSKADTPVWFEGIHRFDQADGTDGDQILLFLCLGIVFFDNMCHKAQVALYQHIAGVQIALGTPFQIRLLLLRCQRLRK